MAKITRTTHKIFGLSGLTSFFGKFGSAKAGSPLNTKDITTIMALGAWDDGWQNALVTTVNGKAPCLEEENSVTFVHSTQIAYLFQEGTPEWDSGTNYFENSIVKLPLPLGGSVGAPQIFASNIDNNLGNQPPPGANNANWQWLNPPIVIPSPTTVGNSLKSKLVVGCASDTQVTVSADLLSIKGIISSLPDVILTTLSLVVSSSNPNGANGLDTGTIASGTWYAIHAITNNTGSISAGLFSTSPTAPTLPVGYTKFRRVGWVYRNGSGKFVHFQSSENWIYFTDAVENFIASTPTGTVTLQGLPSTSKLGAFTIRFSASGGSANINWKVTGTSMFAIVPIRMGSQSGESIELPANLPVSGSQQVDLTYSSGTITYIKTIGYHDPV